MPDVKEDNPYPLLLKERQDDEGYQEKRYDDDDDNVEYEVKCIIGKRVSSSAGIEYFIVWLGYPISDSTWEHEENLNCPKAISNFEDQVQYERREGKANNIHFEPKGLAVLLEEARQLYGELNVFEQDENDHDNDQPQQLKQTLDTAKEIISQGSTVVKILDSIKDINGERYYRVLWKNGKKCWAPAKKLPVFHSLLQAYEHSRFKKERQALTKAQQKPRPHRVSIQTETPKASITNGSNSTNMVDSLVTGTSKMVTMLPPPKPVEAFILDSSVDREIEAKKKSDDKPSQTKLVKLNQPRDLPSSCISEDSKENNVSANTKSNNSNGSTIKDKHVKPIAPLRDGPLKRNVQIIEDSSDIEGILIEEEVVLSSNKPDAKPTIRKLRHGSSSIIDSSLSNTPIKPFVHVTNDGDREKEAHPTTDLQTIPIKEIGNRHNCCHICKQAKVDIADIDSSLLFEKDSEERLLNLKEVEKQCVFVRSCSVCGIVCHPVCFRQNLTSPLAKEEFAEPLKIEEIGWETLYMHTDAWMCIYCVFWKLFQISNILTSRPEKAVVENWNRAGASGNYDAAPNTKKAQEYDIEVFNGYQFLVKFKDRSYRHLAWVPFIWLKQSEAPLIRSYLQRLLKENGKMSLPPRPPPSRSLVVNSRWTIPERIDEVQLLPSEIVSARKHEFAKKVEAAKLKWFEHHKKSDDGHGQNKQNTKNKEDEEHAGSSSSCSASKLLEINSNNAQGIEDKNLKASNPYIGLDPELYCSTRSVFVKWTALEMDQSTWEDVVPSPFDEPESYKEWSDLFKAWKDKCTGSAKDIKKYTKNLDERAEKQDADSSSSADSNKVDEDKDTVNMSELRHECVCEHEKEDGALEDGEIAATPADDDDQEEGSSKSDGLQDKLLKDNTATADINNSCNGDIKRTQQEQKEDEYISGPLKRAQDICDNEKKVLETMPKKPKTTKTATQGNEDKPNRDYIPELTNEADNMELDLAMENMAVTAETGPIPIPMAQPQAALNPVPVQSTIMVPGGQPQSLNNVQKLTAPSSIPIPICPSRANPSTTNLVLPQQTPTPSQIQDSQPALPTASAQQQIEDYSKDMASRFKETVHQLLRQPYTPLKVPENIMNQDIILILKNAQDYLSCRDIANNKPCVICRDMIHPEKYCTSILHPCFPVMIKSMIIRKECLETPFIKALLGWYRIHFAIFHIRRIALQAQSMRNNNNNNSNNNGHQIQTNSGGGDGEGIVLPRANTTTACLGERQESLPRTSQTLILPQVLKPSQQQQQQQPSNITASTAQIPASKPPQETKTPVFSRTMTLEQKRLHALHLTQKWVTSPDSVGDDTRSNQNTKIASPMRTLPPPAKSTPAAIAAIATGNETPSKSTKGMPLVTPELSTPGSKSIQAVAEKSPTPLPVVSHQPPAEDLAKKPLEQNLGQKTVSSNTTSTLANSAEGPSQSDQPQFNEHSSGNISQPIPSSSSNNDNTKNIPSEQQQQQQSQRPQKYTAKEWMKLLHEETFRHNNIRMDNHVASNQVEQIGQASLYSVAPGLSSQRQQPILQSNNFIGSVQARSTTPTQYGAPLAQRIESIPDIGSDGRYQINDARYQQTLPLSSPPSTPVGSAYYDNVKNIYYVRQSNGQFMIHYPQNPQSPIATSFHGNTANYSNNSAGVLHYSQPQIAGIGSNSHNQIINTTTANIYSIPSSPLHAIPTAYNISSSSSSSSINNNPHYPSPLSSTMATTTTIPNSLGEGAPTGFNLFNNNNNNNNNNDHPSPAMNYDILCPLCIIEPHDPDQCITHRFNLPKLQAQYNCVSTLRIPPITKNVLLRAIKSYIDEAYQAQYNISQQ
ncbi:Chromobox protein 3 [Mycoemilia scoparia]|uniref:Chromobox protein 3 n=1 Tax=Mycoemilia scoparia TaxID=417184 RepID=A0A9W7ZV16_9FUNG|nr:Chromobox protein 3 [Mycoemilia scoparia]